MIRRGLDVKVNVKPIFLGLQHQYYYEGPCRFAKGDALTPEYEAIMAQELQKQFFANIDAHMPDAVKILKPVFIMCHDDWLAPESAFEEMTTDEEEIDVFLISGGIARSALLIELAERTHKPIIQDPEVFADLTAIGAALRARGLVGYEHLTWEGIATRMRALRVVKALKQANIMLAVRFDANSAKSGNDTFVTLNHVTEAFGTHFRILNLHELLDYMQPIPEGGNYTTPGRMNTPNITPEEIEQAEALAKELEDGAEEVSIRHEYLVNSCKAYIEVRKLLDLNDCCAFTAPCPDLCSTRRANEMKFTFCLTHSLLNEQGIPSACEYDIDAALSMLILSTISGHAPFMGNTLPLVYQADGTIRQIKHFNQEDIADVGDLHNLVYTGHSVPNRKLKGIDGAPDPYGIHHFAYDQGFGAVMRHDFKKDVGQEITVARLSPDCKKLFVGHGTVVAGGDYSSDNCNGYVVYRVENQEKFFAAQCHVGNHLPLIYGNYVKELEMVGETLGLQVLSV